jgi:hypothetical protein
MSINLETDKFHCWVCSLAGTKIYFLIKKYISREKATEYNENFGDVKYATKKQETFKIRMPDKYVSLLNCRDSVIGDMAWNYITKERKIREIDIIRYKIGLNLEGKHYGGILFPSFDEYGELNYHITRHLNGPIKYYGAEVPKDYRNQIVVNELNIDWKKPITIVEGFIDAIKTGETNVVPLCGSYFSKHTKLFDKITEHRTPVYLALDADARKKTLTIAKNLIHRDIDVFVIDTDDIEDIGSMDYGDFAKRKKCAKSVTEDFLFLEGISEATG